MQSTPRFFLSALIVLLSGCASNLPAPVIDRSEKSAQPSASVQTVAPGERQAAGVPQGDNPGFHTVRKGETLYSIALEHGQNYRDVAAWNNLSDPTAIKEGQVLRVSPTNEAANETRNAAAVTTPVTLESVQGRPLNETRPVVIGPNSATSKTSPKGEKIAYSDRTYAELTGTPVQPQAQTPAVVAPPETKPAVAAPGALSWAWPADGKVIEPFDESRHKGLAIAGKRGDPVRAAADGRVVYVGNGMRGYGNMIVVSHSDGYLSVYAHNDKILVEEKQVVKQGQKIAEIGASDTDRPKLHFEIRYQGKPTDPAKYLPERK
ncbi:MAG: LysM peptidoglycan-binding domain-containing protein [Burkholderiaceae bacterium]|nr:MAG: LysM peptidoglycan-binding domain-containing protein [Burkholderiaceae bacterium]